MLNTAPTWARFHRTFEAFQVNPLTLCLKLNRTITTIAHPTGQPIPACRHHGEIAESYALHHAGYQHVHALWR